MNKIIKFAGGTLLLGIAAASIAGIIMAKKGTLDPFIKKFKKEHPAKKKNPDDIFEERICMISETDCDENAGNKYKTLYGSNNFRPSSNGKY